MVRKGQLQLIKRSESRQMGTHQRAEIKDYISGNPPESHPAISENNAHICVRHIGKNSD